MADGEIDEEKVISDKTIDDDEQKKTSCYYSYLHCYFYPSLLDVAFPQKGRDDNQQLQLMTWNSANNEHPPT